MVTPIMMGVEVRLDEQMFDQLTSTLGLTKRKVEVAGFRSVRKTARWVKTHLARELSKELQIVQKIIRQRLRVYVKDKKAMQAKVWMGMYKIKASRLGRVRQTRTGVSVGRHRFPGAFQATMKTYHTDVYERRDDARLPIDLVELDISEKAMKVLNAVSERTEARLMKIMQQEINYEIQKLKNRVN